MLQNQDDMFERYLKKPSMSSVGFLVLDKMTSVTSSRQNPHHPRHPPLQERPSAKTVSRGGGSRPARNSSSKQRGGIGSDTAKSPILSRSSANRGGDHQFKGGQAVAGVGVAGGGGATYAAFDDGDSFAVSLLQTTFEQEGQSSQYDILLRQRKFDTLSTG